MEFASLNGPQYMMAAVMEMNKICLLSTQAISCSCLSGDDIDLQVNFAFFCHF